MDFSILFLISLLVVIIYNILNYLETQYIQKEQKPIKIVIKDSIIIILASLMSLWLFTKYESYFLDFFTIIMNNSGVAGGKGTMGISVNKDIPVFTDSPDF